VVKLDDRGRLAVPNPDDDLAKSCYDVKRFLDRFTWLDKMSSTIGALAGICTRSTTRTEIPSSNSTSNTPMR